MTIIERHRISAAIAEAQPKLIRVVAPAGYGKTNVSLQLVSDHDRIAVCDCLGIVRPIEIAKRLLASISKWLDSEGEQLMMAAACTEDDFAAWMRLIVTAWHADDKPGAIIIDNLEALADDINLRTPLTELLARPHASRTAILCSRTPVPLRTTRFAAPDAIMTLGFDDLRFDVDEIARVLGPSSALADNINNLTRGWPIAVQLISQLLARRKLDNVEKLLSDFDLEELYAYIAAEVYETLPAAQRELLAVLAQVPAGTSRDLVRLQVAPDEATASSRLAAVAPFATRTADDAYALHPLMKATIDKDATENASPDRFRRPGRLAAASALMRIRLLDGELERDGQVIPLSAREFELLSYLALKRGPISTEQIVDEIWGQTHHSGASSLKVYVSRLRGRLGGKKFLRSTTRGYVLDGVQVDVFEIDAALTKIRAVIRERSWDDPDVTELSWWLKRLGAALPASMLQWRWFAASMVDLKRSVVDALLAFACEALRGGQNEAARRTATDVLAADDCDEYALEIAMRACVALGEVGAGWRYLHRYESALAEDLGAEPATHLRELLLDAERAGSRMTLMSVGSARVIK